VRFIACRRTKWGEKTDQPLEEKKQTKCRKTKIEEYGKNSEGAKKKDESRTPELIMGRGSNRIDYFGSYKGRDLRSRLIKEDATWKRITNIPDHLKNERFKD